MPGFGLRNRCHSKALTRVKAFEAKLLAKNPDAKVRYE